LANARIVPLFANGKDEARFAVVTGPYRSKDRATNTITRLGLSKDVVIKAAPSALAQASSQQVQALSLRFAALCQCAVRTKPWFWPYLRMRAAGVGPIGVHRAMTTFGI